MNDRFTCTACGAVAGDLPFRCPGADGGDDGDHVLSRASADGRHAPGDPGWSSAWSDDTSAANPFARYRRRLSFWSLGRSRGLEDEALVGMVRQLDAAVAGVEGRGFVTTPFQMQPAVGDALSSADAAPRVWVKDETGNVSGSHKARHLMGVMLYLQVAERVGILSSRPPSSRARPRGRCTPSFPLPRIPR